MLIDTSVLIDLFKARGPGPSRRFKSLVSGRDFALTRFTQIELLQGSRDESDWNALEDYLEVQTYAECSETVWRNAARTYFELRQRGKTVRSVIDCCIAEIAIEIGTVLVHKDKDFVAISLIRPLKQRYVDIRSD
jgi:predicted nucleic acid-binding protein